MNEGIEMKSVLEKLECETQQIISHQNETLELFIRNFMTTLNPKIKELSQDIIVKRDIVRCIQGDKTWFTTHGSRASKILKMKIECEGNIVRSKISII